MGMATGLSTVNALESKISAIAGNSMVNAGLLAAGFMMGVTSIDAPGHVGDGTHYPFSTQGVSDVVARIAGKSTAASFGLPTGNADRTFKPTAIINRGTLWAVVLAVANDNAPDGQIGRIVRLAYKVGFPYALGYGIGRVFDDPPSQPTSAGYNDAQTNNLARANALPSASMPWTRA